jgi:hypothetical protein
MKACAQVVQLRKELAAARDYEHLSLRALELRKGVAETPIVATADPLPAAFNATLGRLLPLNGTEGVALLLTIVVELLSCVGFGGIAVLHNTRKQREGGVAQTVGALAGKGSELRVANGEAPCQPQSPTLPKPSLRAHEPSLNSLAPSAGRPRRRRKREPSEAPSNILPLRPRSALDGLAGEAPPKTIPSKVSDFVQQRLKRATGASLGATELRSIYEAWCKLHGCVPLSAPKFAAELKRLGIDKWKSSGLIRYRDLQLAA